MKKLLITLSLLFVSTFAFAEWVLITRNGGVGDYYIDKSSINRVGNSARFWRYTNFKEKPRIKGVKSVVALEEYDCINQTLRFVSFTEYSEYDLKGTSNKIPTDQLPEKEFILPNTDDYRLMDVLCAYKDKSIK